MKKILIIDDDPNSQEIYTDLLTSEGYEVIKEITVQKGIITAKSRHPDLIILDIMLPGGLNWFDALEQFKKDVNLAKIPVLILTNLDTEEKVALNIGASAYLVKANISIDKTLAKIKELLE